MPSQTHRPLHALLIGAALVTGLNEAALASSTEAAPPEVAAEVVMDPLAQAIRLRLAEILKRSKADLPREQLEAISAFYAAHRNAPLWVEPAGLRTQAIEALNEIRRADEWGLDPSAFDLPASPLANASTDALADAELRITVAVVKYAAQARGWRVDPSALSEWLDQRPRPFDLAAVLTQTSTAPDPAGVLRQQHPQHRQFELLRQAYLAARIASAQPPAEPVQVRIPAGPRLRPGDRHPDIAVIRQRLKITAQADAEDLYDPELVTAVRAFMRTVGFKNKEIIDDRVRSALNAKPKKEPETARAPSVKKILTNMERWRWLPEDLGTLHIWNNLPEFETRVLKGGDVIHQERIIIGKPELQTPVFSNAMRFVVFHPDWGVPNSIKIKDLMPHLRNGNAYVFERRDMRVVVNGRTVDPSRIDWSRVDVRNVSVIQDPGPNNPLGQLKFMFPNRHDVYMHDTPQKELFNSAVRTFSSGCIRVRNPRRLAELLFAEDQSWSSDDVARRLLPKAAQNSRVDLGREIPVHNVYFTVVAEENGQLRSFADVYGHDRRIGDALDGRDIAVIAAADPARAHQQKIRQMVQTARSASRVSRSGSNNFFSILFGGF